MLEKMADFFDARIENYDKHMLEGIEGAREFYPFTAECLPRTPEAVVLDLGCGTGLELEEYFKLNPTARVTGIDMSGEMLKALNEKFPDKSLTLIHGSFFDMPLMPESYDGAVAVEALHHYTKEEKVVLYKKLYAAMKPGTDFILTDYFADSDEDELLYAETFRTVKELEGITDNEPYHYDTPLTVEHETEALREAGFTRVRVLKSWAATYTIRAGK